MISNLVLFCGGDALYQNKRPKPLDLMPNSISVLENYLRQKHLEIIPKITILAEEEFYIEIKEKIESSNDNLRTISVLSVPNDSSTFSKTKTFLSQISTSEDTILFTYPDIFYFGSWDKLLSSEDLNSRMRISGLFLQSRFPEITFNPYVGRVLSINLRTKRVPANASTIYAGHFIARREDLESAINLFENEHKGITNAALEGDFFRFLVSAGKLDVCLLEEAWIKADSMKEMVQIIELLE